MGRGAGGRVWILGDDLLIIWRILCRRQQIRRGGIPPIGIELINAESDNAEDDNYDESRNLPPKLVPQSMRFERGISRNWLSRSHGRSCLERADFNQREPAHMPCESFPRKREKPNRPLLV